MKSHTPTRRALLVGLLLASSMGAVACGEEKASASSEASKPRPGLQPQKLADMLHAVMEADRTVHTRQVVNRLIKEQKVQIMNPETTSAEARR